MQIECNWNIHLVTMTSVVMLFAMIVATVTGSFQEDICAHSIFSPTCDQGAVVVMKRAVYGRMELGECIKTDFGYIGCQSDALQLMDTICSGQPSCSFPVITVDSRLVAMNMCPAELTPYLSVEYDCITVDAASQRYCNAQSSVSSSTSVGILASHVTDTTRCGSQQAPWRITVSPGQRLNVSILDFGWRVQGTSPDEQNDVQCASYGYVVEKHLGVNKTICGGGKRQQHVHLSASNNVDIVVKPSSSRENKASFLLLYAVVGCPDLVPPAHAWYKREGDSTRIGCEWNHNSWHLTCEGNSWSGVVGNCSAPADTPSSSKSEIDSPLSPVLSIALIIGLGVLAVTLICILLIGCIYFKRRRPRPPLAPDLAKCGTMIEQHSLVRRYQPGHAAPMSDDTIGTSSGPPPQQPYPVRCGTGPHGMTASRAPPQPWDRSLPNPRGGPPTWGAGPQPDYSCPRPRGGQGGTLIKDKDKELDTSDSGSDYYWAGTHKYHVLDKDKPDWSH